MNLMETYRCSQEQFSGSSPHGMGHEVAKKVTYEAVVFLVLARDMIRELGINEGVELMK